MKWLKIIGKAVGSFLGIGNASGPSPVQKVAEIADEYRYTKQEQAEAAERAEDRFDRRAVQDSSDTALIMNNQQAPSPYDSIIDKLKRLERPSWWIFFFGGFVGWWEFPDFSAMPQVAFWSTLFIIYFTALFGGRAVYKDLAQAVMTIIEKSRK